MEITAQLVPPTDSTILDALIAHPLTDAILVAMTDSTTIPQSMTPMTPDIFKLSLMPLHFYLVPSAFNLLVTTVDITICSAKQLFNTISNVINGLARLTSALATLAINPIGFEMQTHHMPYQIKTCIPSPCFQL